MNATARRWIMAASILLVCPRLLACGVGGATVPEYSTLVIGPDGGFAAAQNVTLEVPTGALTEDTAVRVIEQPTPLPIEPQADGSTITYYDNIMCIGPLGISLLKPGQLRMCYPNLGLPAGRDESDLRLLEWNEAAGYMQISTTAIQNLDTHCFEESAYQKFGHVAVALRTPPCAFDVRLQLKNTPEDRVDLFLLLDDSDSFGAAASALQSGFANLVTTLQTTFPAVDFAFGVGRFEDYGGPGSDFGGERPTGRPFTLNQPILATSDPGFSSALSTALTTPGPGFGGDRPESLLEALYQVATGAGFDGDGNGSRLDSGPAGALLTQTAPGTSGDVPPFSSSVATTSGSLGGVGFRPGSVRVVLVATGSGSVVPFDSAVPSTVTGTGGTVPVSQFANASTALGSVRFGVPSDATSLASNSTPGAVAPKGAATAQATIAALNALGIRVIGLTNQAGSTGGPVAPATGPDATGVALLQSIATLTGAVDNSGAALVFPIAIGERNQLHPLTVQANRGRVELQDLFDQPAGNVGSMNGDSFTVNGATSDQSGQAAWFPASSASASATVVVEVGAFAPDLQFGIYSVADGARLRLFAGSESSGAVHTFTFTPGVVQLDSAAPIPFDVSAGFGFYLEHPLIPFLYFTEDAKNLNRAYPPGNPQAVAFQGRGGGQSIETPNGVTPLTPLDWVIGFEDIGSRDDLDGLLTGDNDFDDFVCVVQGLRSTDPTLVEGALASAVTTTLTANRDVELVITSADPCLDARPFSPFLLQGIADGEIATFSVLVDSCAPSTATIELRDARSGAQLATGTVIWSAACAPTLGSGSTGNLQIEPRR